MSGYRTSVFSFVATAAVLVVVWSVMVPGSMSRTTFGALSAITFALGAVTLISLQAGRSTRSVVHVLHDADASDDVRSSAGGR